MATMREIEGKAGDLARVRDILKDRVNELEFLLSTMKKKELPGIRRAAESAAKVQGKLRDMIGESADLFQKPKTQIFHGIRLGYQKAKGKIIWENDEQVIKLIKKHFPDQLDVLIKVEEYPLKSALAQLPAADLKKIGVTVEDTNDEIIIKPTDSEIDKIVNAILKEDESYKTGM